MSLFSKTNYKSDTKINDLMILDAVNTIWIWTRIISEHNAAIAFSLIFGLNTRVLPEVLNM